MKISKLPPIEVLQDYFDYNPETGELRWKKVKARQRNRKAGDLAGYTTKEGYTRVTLNHRGYLAHRICWALHYGEDPYPYLIDHKRGVEEGNKIDNLRKATHGENLTNIGKKSNNTSGHRGVYYKKGTEKWGAFIAINKKQIHLGYFECKGDAIKARLQAEKDYNIFVH